MQLPRVSLVGITVGLAFALACGNAQPPASPSPTTSGGLGAGPSGETLKIAAPTLLSPIADAVAQGTPVLMFANVSGTYATFPVTYEVEVKDASGATAVTGKVAAASGASTSYPVTQLLQSEATYSWRVRATYGGGVGPWSSTATFKTQSASYIRGSEVFDPLTNGKTAGKPVGSYRFIPGQGIQLIDQTAYVQYVLEETLQEGELSFVATGFDEGSVGSKSKMLAMSEGTSDLTSNDYRVTVEKRGRDYDIPGQVRWRIITGDAGDEGRIFDGPKADVGFSDANVYFWRFSWRTGSARLQILEGGEQGKTIYDASIGTGSHPYRPTPHVVYIGAPAGRNGILDASVPMIARNFWVSGRSRPIFPTVSSLLTGPVR